MTESIIFKNTITTDIDEVLSRFWDISPEMANKTQIYRALCIVVKNKLTEKRNNFKKDVDELEKKQVYYKYIICVWNFWLGSHCEIIYLT